MEKGYNIELIEQNEPGTPVFQKIRITIEGGVGNVICEYRGFDEGLRFYREGTTPEKFEKVNMAV